MSKNYIAPSNLEPQAKLCLNKNRLKVYNDKIVYLEDKQEFTLELYNPTQSTILVKISFNDKLISSSGIVLRSGERVYLDRYLDSKHKFMFDTYEVSNNKTNQKAIEKNGLVRIDFFSEYIPNIWLNTTGTSTWVTNPGTFTIHTGSPTWINHQLIGTTTSSSNASYTSTSNISGNISLNATSKSIETGIVSKGNQSKQEFNTSYQNFNSWCFKTIEYQILPKSNKPVESMELRRYCGNCGCKAKKEHNFCPSCGSKL